MLSPLKFVMGAVAKKNFQPALTHFRISNGRVTGFNGVVALSSPIDLDLEAMPKALPFVKAIERCTDTIAIHLTDAGRLALRSGKFRAYVECGEDGAEILDGIQPEGVGVEIPGVFVDALRALEPFVGVDASRPWATGVLLRGQSAYATNNIILIEKWLGVEMPEVNIPASAINELIRLKEEPIAATLGENSITFHFEGERWMRSQLLSTDWPAVDHMLDKCTSEHLIPPPAGLFEAVETIKPFVGDEGRIYFRAGRVSTSNEDGAGASIELEGVPETGAFHVDHLLSLQSVVESIDFTTHPQPSPFRGQNIRGIFIGMVDA